MSSDPCEDAETPAEPEAPVPAAPGGDATASAPARRVEEPEADDVDAEETEEDKPEREWWDDPGMPWKHKPTSSDVACLAWIGVIGILGLIMLPLRGWLLGHSVPVLVALTGSRSATAAMGSLVRVGDFVMWWWPLIAGLIMSIKLDWVYWWAGKLWGHGMIEVWAGQSERAKRTYARAERWAVKWGAFGMFIAYVPIPLPVMAVVFVLAGASGMSIRKFVALDAASCLVWLGAYLLLGYAIGGPAVEVLQYYAKIANYVAIALVAVVVISYVVGARRKAKAKAAAAA